MHREIRIALAGRSANAKPLKAIVKQWEKQYQFSVVKIVPPSAAPHVLIIYLRRGRNQPWMRTVKSVALGNTNCPCVIYADTWTDAKAGQLATCLGKRLKLVLTTSHVRKIRKGDRGISVLRIPDEPSAAYNAARRVFAIALDWCEQLTPATQEAN